MATDCTKNYLAGCGGDNHPLSRRLLSVSNLTVYEGDFEIFVDIDLLGSQVDDLFGLSKYPEDLIGSLALLNCSWRGGRSRFRCRSRFRRGSRVCCRRLARCRLLVSLVVRLRGVVLLNFEDFRDGLQHFIIGWRGAFGVKKFECALVTHVAIGIAEQGENDAI